MDNQAPRRSEPRPIGKGRRLVHDIPTVDHSLTSESEYHWTYTRSSVEFQRLRVSTLRTDLQLVIRIGSEGLSR